MKRLDDAGGNSMVWDHHGFQLRPLPILIVLGMGVGLHLISQVSLEIFEHFVRLPERPEMPWIADWYGHVALLGFTLLTIGILQASRPGDYGLRLPEGPSLVGQAVLAGLGLGILVTAIDYAPQLFSLRPPSDRPYPLTPLNVTGWLTFAGVFAAPTEELLYRGLMLTWLADAMPGRVTIRGVSLSGAGLVVAGLFALADVDKFLREPFVCAVGHLVIMFALGALCATWLERSKSLLAPALGHAVFAVTTYALIFAMVAGFR